MYWQTFCSRRFPYKINTTVKVEFTTVIPSTYCRLLTSFTACKLFTAYLHSVGFNTSTRRSRTWERGGWPVLVRGPTPEPALPRPRKSWRILRGKKKKKQKDRNDVKWTCISNPNQQSRMQSAPGSNCAVFVDKLIERKQTSSWGHRTQNICAIRPALCADGLIDWIATSSVNRRFYMGTIEIRKKTILTVGETCRAIS